MWSRRFASIGLLSGVAAAALALAGMWLVISITSRFPMPPSWIGAATMGLIIYPICWYALIFRARDDSLRRTFHLIAGTYLTCCLVVMIIAIGLAFYSIMQPGSSLAPNRSTWDQLVWSIIGVPALAVLYAGTLALLLAIPFLAVAAPFAFLHRALLRALFLNRLDVSER